MPQRPFNRQPRGLLSFLDGKVPSAQSPQLFEDALRCTLDLLPFYEAQTREIVSGVTLAPVAEGPVFATGGNLVVPQDELWLVWQYSAVASLVLGAGETLAMCTLLRVFAALGANQDQILGASFGNGGVGSLPVAFSPRPFVAAPGDALGIFVTFHVAAANPINLSALLTRLKL